MRFYNFLVRRPGTHVGNRTRMSCKSNVYAMIFFLVRGRYEGPGISGSCLFIFLWSGEPGWTSWNEPRYPGYCPFSRTSGLNDILIIFADTHSAVRIEYFVPGSVFFYTETARARRDVNFFFLSSSSFIIIDDNNIIKNKSSIQSGILLAVILAARADYCLLSWSH